MGLCPHSVVWLLRLLVVCAVAAVAAVSVTAKGKPGAEATTQSDKGYRLLRVPPNWKFEIPTPAYDPENGEKLGDFQPGIRVEVLDADPAADNWLVRYATYGAPPVEAHIDWPNFSKVYIHRWPQLQRELSEAELIDLVLGSETPWLDSLSSMAEKYLKGNVKLDAGTPEAPQRILVLGAEFGTLWGVRPIFAAVENGPDGRPIISVEVWNKAEGRIAELKLPGRSVNNTYHLLREKLEGLSRHFDGNTLSRPEDSDNTLSLVREQRSIHPLANRTQALLRYQRNEYLILELRPFEPPPPPHVQSDSARSGNARAAGALSQRLRQNVTDNEDGYRYLADIPMINQGDKGYCVAATIARVLQYYGFQVDMHQMAYLAETERYGTSYRDMVNAMRRVCNTTPYRFRTVRTRDRAELARMSVERGMPLIWLVPGHVRLLIGFNPEEGSIVYSDSWGPGHEFKTMPWSQFMNLTVDLFLLDVGDN